MYCRKVRRRRTRFWNLWRIDVGYRRGKSANSDVPMNIFYGKDETEVEDITTTLANTAPFLYLFFDKNKKFEMAHITGDKHVVDLHANDVVIYK